jgi:hypothetical protein
MYIYMYTYTYMYVHMYTYVHRAQTIIAVDLFQKSLKRKGLDLLVLEVDWLLWEKGKSMFCFICYIFPSHEFIFLIDFILY